MISCEIFSHVKFHIISHNFTCYHMISHEITCVNSCGFFVRDIFLLCSIKIEYSVFKVEEKKDETTTTEEIISLASK